MVPSPPGRSASLQDNQGNPLTFPYVLNNSQVDVNDIEPELPETFTIRCVINGVSGPEKRYPEDDNSVIWENEGNQLTWSKYPRGNYLIGISTKQSVTINSFELYIDGDKVAL